MKYEKYQSFLSEKFQFLEVKFSIYLNRCVFGMILTFKKKPRRGLNDHKGREKILTTPQ